MSTIRISITDPIMVCPPLDIYREEIISAQGIVTAMSQICAADTQLTWEIRQAPSSFLTVALATINSREKANERWAELVCFNMNGVGGVNKPADIDYLFHLFINPTIKRLPPTTPSIGLGLYQFALTGEFINGLTLYKEDINDADPAKPREVGAN